MTGRPSGTPVLVQLVYASTATRDLGSDDLDSLAALTQGRNTRLGITGFLFYQPPRFFALLEGTERRVMACMERIIADPRHRNVTVLREERVPVQRFRNWSFGQLPADGNPRAAVISAEFVRSLAGARAQR